MSAICFLLDENVPLMIQARLQNIEPLPRRMNINAILDDLLLMWGAGLPDEFQDQIVYLPLRR